MAKRTEADEKREREEALDKAFTKTSAVLMRPARALIRRRFSEVLKLMQSYVKELETQNQSKLSSALAELVSRCESLSSAVQAWRSIRQYPRSTGTFWLNECLPYALGNTMRVLDIIRATMPENQDTDANINPHNPDKEMDSFVAELMTGAHAMLENALKVEQEGWERSGS